MLNCQDKVYILAIFCERRKFQPMRALASTFVCVMFAGEKGQDKGKFGNSLSFYLISFCDMETKYYFYLK